MIKTNKFINTFILILCSLFFILYSPIHAATSTDSADVDPETIKENIKKRIEQVIKNQSDINKKRLAYVGSLSSFTTNSFSLETTEGITRQASTSASTIVVELPNNKEVKLEDISIGDYIAALGYLNDNTQVLDTRRILILKNKPVPPTKKSIVGAIRNIDIKNSLLVINSLSSGQEISFKISKKALIQLTDDSLKKTKIPVKEIPNLATCLVIYEPAESKNETNLASSILIKSQSASPSAKPKNQ